MGNRSKAVMKNIDVILPCHWCPRGDSNPYLSGFKSAASACSATWAFMYGGRGGFRDLDTQGFNLLLYHLSYPPIYGVPREIRTPKIQCLRLPRMPVPPQGHITYGRGVEPLNPHRFVVAHLHNAYPNFRANLDFGTNRQPQPLQHCHSSSHHKGGMLGLVPASLRCAKIRSFLDLAAEAALLFSATALCHADPYVLVPPGGFEPPTQGFSVPRSTGLSYKGLMAGIAGFEPAKCGSQSPVPYRLAIPQYLVPGAGLEPARLSTMDFESTASAYSAIWAYVWVQKAQRTFTALSAYRIDRAPAGFHRYILFLLNHGGKGGTRTHNDYCRTRFRDGLTTNYHTLPYGAQGGT